MIEKRRLDVNIGFSTTTSYIYIENRDLSSSTPTVAVLCIQISRNTIFLLEQNRASNIPAVDIRKLYEITYE